MKNIEVVPWDHQSGGETFHVIFASKVWKNDWWVEADHCPSEAVEDPKHNPWRIQRDATQEEIAKGNPTSCDGATDCTKLLCQDPKRVSRYAHEKFRPS